MAASEYHLQAETHQIIGCSMEVINELGHGFHEKIYENALVVEFGLRGIPFVQQPEYPVVYKAANVGTYIPDLTVSILWSWIPKQSKKLRTMKSGKC